MWFGLMEKRENQEFEPSQALILIYYKSQVHLTLFMNTVKMEMCQIQRKQQREDDDVTQIPHGLFSSSNTNTGLNINS